MPLPLVGAGPVGLAMAIELERPVKWTEDRRENLMVLNQSREQEWTLEAGADAEGNLLHTMGVKTLAADAEVQVVLGC